ncbi:hypothetical protein [Neptunicella marina]|uniref:Uncharacterized protein n=1 Tax=Neptunicella marina TaxID=2125989 RepID=A0A8J6IJI3_9ALTE|nr:hypothetical protein [Neptunicella marina]MBC3764380.1 hypothetical protein [Neptunicella marina]
MSIVSVLEKIASDAGCNSDDKFNETIQNADIDVTLKQVLLEKNNTQLKDMLDLPVFMASTIATPDDDDDDKDGDDK